jgi:hypothetical protein
MSIIGIVVVLLVLALVWWLFSTYILPRVPEPFKTIIIVVLVLAVCLWLLNMVGLFGGGGWNKPLWNGGR